MLEQFIELDRERCTRIDELCREYENAWYRDVEPSLSSFVERVPLEDRLDCLRELLATDFELRINEQREIPIAELLTQFPEHTDLISDIYREVIETAVPIPKPVPKSALMGTTIGDYRLVREIGRGGMGVVYEALHETLQRTVALKVLPAGHEFDQNRISRFAREARAIARLHHEHIVEVYGAGEVDGTHFIAMQFISGESLDRLLARAEHRREFVESTFGKSGSKRSKAVSGKALSEGDLEAHREVSSLSLRVGHSASEMPDSESQATRKPSGDFALVDSGNQQAAFAETVIQPVAQAARLSATSASESESIQRQAGEPPALRGDINFAPELGKTFSDRCRKVAEIGQQMAEALSYAHSNGVLHRDLKPANILLDQQGNAWLTDFGLAKVDEANTALTESGNIVGTMKYLAPEALNGQTDERSDVYSLGLTLYELLSGHTAFDALDQAKLLQAILHSEPTRLSELLPSAPRDLVTIIHKSIDREPSGRYQTAQEFADDLQRFLHDEPIRGRELSHSERFTRWAKRNKLLATLLISLGVIVSVVAISSTIAAGHFQQLNSKLGQSVVDLTTKTNELTEKTNQLTEARNKAQADAVENQRLARAAELARQGAQSTLADMQTERGFLAGREKQPAVAALWFANAATLTPHDPDRQRANHLRAASWLDEALVPAASLMTPGSNWDQVFCQPGGSLLLAVGGGHLRVWDWRNNLVLPWSEELKGVGEAQAQWSPDGRLLAVGSSTGEVRLLEPVSGKVWKQFRHPEQARVLKWSAQGTRLAVGDKRVQVWNVADEPKLEFD